MISDDIIHEAQNYEVMFNDILKADTDRRLKQEITRDINWARKTLRKNDRIIWFLRWSKIWYQLSGGIWAGGRADTSLSAALQQYNQRFQTRYVAGDLRSPPVLKTQLEHFLGLPVPETSYRTVQVMGKAFDPAQPQAYLDSFAIKRS